MCGAGRNPGESAANRTPKPYSVSDFALEPRRPASPDSARAQFELDGMTDLLGLIALHAEKLDDAADHARFVGGEILIGYDERFDAAALEPSGPAEPFPLEQSEAFRDQIPVVAQGRGALSAGDASQSAGFRPRTARRATSTAWASRSRRSR